jgi:Ran GTPase-activating protein (RanGAP) involved in mRNA processing and transport
MSKEPEKKLLDIPSDKVELKADGKNIYNFNKTVLKIQNNKNTNLKNIKLEFSNIDSEQLKTIIGLVQQKDSNITSLDLRLNQIGDTGAKDLAVALKDNKTLVFLYLFGTIF